MASRGVRGETMEQIKRYPSIAALARDARETDCCALAIPRPASWFNGETPADSIARAISGDDSLVAEAERLLSRINAAIDMPERPFVADVAGAYPVVAEYLAGMPDCMRRRAIVENEAAPVRLFYGVGSWVGITAAELLRRGCAALALTMALSRVRPVELVLYHHTRSGERESLIFAPVNTQPLDVASAAYALSSSGFARWLFYNLARHHHFGRRAACGLRFPEGTDTPAYAARLRRLLGADTSDVILDEPRSHDDPAIADPVAWVNAQLAKFREAAQ